MSKFDEFYKSHVGKVWDKYGRRQYVTASQVYDPYGGQCVSLIKAWLYYLFGDRVASSYGDAKDYWINKSSSGILTLCEVVTSPQDGDIVVSAGSDPTYGHIWIWANGSAFSQNVAGDPAARIYPLSWQGAIWGYLRPRYRLIDELKGEPMEEIVKVTEKPAGSVYRLYNPASGDHLYTSDFHEAAACQEAGWTYEGVGWVSPKTGDSVYRLLNPNSGKHHYTADSSESKALVDLGWTYEGVAFYSGGKKPLYRMYNPQGGEHIITAHQTEHDALTRAGWRCEGQPLKGTK